MMKFRRFQLTAVLLVTMLALSGTLVAGQDAETTIVIPTTTMDVARELHPNDAHFALGLSILSNVAETLVRYSPDDGSIEPHLATDWEVSDDGLSITFNLREGVTFHNGDSLTADDVVASWQVIEADEVVLGPFANMLRTLNEVSVEKVDDFTVMISLAEPNPAIFDILAFGLFVGPQGPMLADIENIDGSRLQRYPIGTGPYMVVDHETDDVVLEAFDDYWGGRPSIDRVVLQSRADTIGVAAAMRAGEGSIAAYDVNAMAGLEEDPSFELLTTPTTTVCTLFTKPDFSSPFMAERDVRVALAHAIDRQNIINTVFGGQAVEVAYWRAPGLPLAPAVDPIPYDPELAEELMLGAGFEKNDDGIWTRDGEIFELTFANIDPTSRRTDMNLLIADNFSDFGVAVRFEDFPDVSTYRSVPEARTYLLYSDCTGWTNFLPLDFRTLANSSTNEFRRYYLFREGYAPPAAQIERIDAMFNTFDRDELQRLIDEYIQVAQDDMAPFIPLVAPTSSIIHSTRLQNVQLNSQPGAQGWLPFISEWELAE